MKLRILYTARDGGETARTAPLEARRQRFKKKGRTVMFPLHSFFGGAWSRFTSPHAERRILSLRFKTDDLPFELRHTSSVSSTSLFFEVELGAGSTCLELADQNVGTLDSPIGLQGNLSDPVRFTPNVFPQLGKPVELQFAAESPSFYSNHAKTLQGKFFTYD